MNTVILTPDDFVVAMWRDAVPGTFEHISKMLVLDDDMLHGGGAMNPSRFRFGNAHDGEDIGVTIVKLRLRKVNVRIPHVPGLVWPEQAVEGN